MMQQQTWPGNVRQLHLIGTARFDSGCRQLISRNSRAGCAAGDRTARAQLMETTADAEETDQARALPQRVGTKAARIRLLGIERKTPGWTG
jgi:transcriptional regulator of acetoin/glycerol metabolism